MKYIMNSTLAIFLLSVIVSCAERSAEDILNDPDQRDELLTTIANDSSLLMELHERTRSVNNMSMEGSSSMMRSCMSMMDNPEMRSMMMDHMMMMGEKDSSMRRMICDKIMNSENMRSMMEERMHEGMEMGGKKD